MFFREVTSDWLVGMLARSRSQERGLERLGHGNEVSTGQWQENKMADEPW